MKQILVIVFGLFLCLEINSYIFAEERAFPHSNEFLLKDMSLIFVGKVQKIYVCQQEKSIPEKAEVLLSIKGDLGKDAIIDIQPYPKCNYFEEELDQPKVGDIGIFYVKQDGYGQKILFKYKKLNLKSIR
ncbi:MAG: hypothetical protein AB1629_03705 [Candidatus Omnitrophota bacterium]